MIDHHFINLDFHHHLLSLAIEMQQTLRRIAMATRADCNRDGDGDGNDLDGDGDGLTVFE